MRVCLAVGIVVCVLVCSHAAPIDQQDTRNFIPNRYDIKGTLIHDDGTITRQDPPPQQTDEQQSMYDQFGGGQTSNLAYQQQGDYQTQDDAPNGQQAFQDYQEPESNSMAGQNDQEAYYKTQQNQQDMPAEQNTQGYEGNPQNMYTQNDDLQGQGQQGQGQQSYNTQPQEYRANYNDQEPPESQFQAGQAYYGQQPSQEGQQEQIQDYQPPSQEGQQQQIQDYQPPSQEGQQQQIQDYQPPSQGSDDIQGNAARNTIEKPKEIEVGATKKYQIPNNLSRKDLEGMLGNTKQIYLRGGH